MLVLIKGAGDLASGVAYRLRQCHFDIIMTETALPTTVRTTVAFSRAVYEKTAKVEDVTARLAQNYEQAKQILQQGEIAVMVDPQVKILAYCKPDALVDAIIAKENLGTKIEDAPVVVALGPGFTAGKDCDCVVETQRGHNLGRPIYRGRAAENTGIPGNIAGHTADRIIRSVCDGTFTPKTEIGRLVKAGDVVATVDGQPIFAAIDGVVRGLLPKGTPVRTGMKSGDIDPRGIKEYCDTISDKARAISGGVLEAILHLSKERR